MLNDHADETRRRRRGLVLRVSTLLLGVVHLVLAAVLIALPGGSRAFDPLPAPEVGAEQATEPAGEPRTGRPVAATSPRSAAAPAPPTTSGPPTASARPYATSSPANHLAREVRRAARRPQLRRDPAHRLDRGIEHPVRPPAATPRPSPSPSPSPSRVQERGSVPPSAGVREAGKLAPAVPPSAGERTKVARPGRTPTPAVAPSAAGVPPGQTREPPGRVRGSGPARGNGK
uniref:hypothetical protein n=1 Tax=Nonomuraea gerenzanensis TaxID=93944 RepID=UPI00287FD979|nr:hypothetical protein [Nonomuraea gerenzanensis]